MELNGVTGLQRDIVPSQQSTGVNGKAFALPHHHDLTRILVIEPSGGGDYPRQRQTFLPEDFRILHIAHNTDAGALRIVYSHECLLLTGSVSGLGL